MRYPYLIALAIFLAMPTVSTPADEPTADQRLKADRPPPSCSNIRQRRGKPTGVFSEDGLARFRLLSGRIDVDPMRYRKGSQEHAEDNFREQITVASSSGIPTVYYSFQDDFQRVQLNAEHGKSLRIESTILATGERALLQQHGREDIQWTIRRNPERESELDQSVCGPTLLHIIGQDEAGFEVHLESLTSRMLLGRSVIDMTNRTASFLNHNSSTLSVVSSDEINAWIDQLRSPRSSQRRAAATALSRYGTCVIPYLSAALQRDDLDVEQLARIRCLVSRQPRTDEDTPSSLACLLSTDRRHWQILARKMDQTQWIAANDHVRRCGLDALTR